MQIGRTSEWLKIIVDYRNYTKLNFDDTTYCRNGYITFGNFKNGTLDGRCESILRRPSFWEIGRSSSLLQTVNCRINFEPKTGRFRTKPPVWSYAVNAILGFETRCTNRSDGPQIRAVRQDFGDNKTGAIW
jgi:hypothetical protein